MTPVFEFVAGDSPLLISVPHDGRQIPPAIADRMTEAGAAIPDTDWEVAKLYDFAPRLGASMIIANFSRYVVDLNRSADDAVLYPGQVATGLCPSQTFAGDDIYQGGDEVHDDERRSRVETYWNPYHQRIRETLAAIRARHGFALLWDAHSIPSSVPRLFDGELPVLNLGSNDGKSCDKNIEVAVAQVARNSPHSSVCNGRFKGGYITRCYGDRENSVHALQLEIAQRAYMNEETHAWHEQSATDLRVTLENMLTTFAGTANG